MKDQKRFAALAISAVMVVSMAGSVSAAQKVESKDDLAGATIGVQLGTTGDLDASEYEKDGSTVERYNKGSEAVQALKAGQIDCVIIDSQPAQKFVENNDDLKILDEPFEQEEYAICLKKGNDELLDKINGALKELKDDGTIDSIMSNYIGEDAGNSPYESPEDVDRSNGTLVMATNAEFEPYEYHEGDAIVGIDVDIAQAICDKLGYELIVLYSDNQAEIVAKETDVARVTLLRAHGNDEGYEVPEQYKEKEVVLDADGNIATPESADELVAYVTLLEYDDIDQFDQQFKDLGILDENGDFNTETIKGIADEIEARNLATYDVAE